MQARLAGLAGYVYVAGGFALYITLFRAGVPAGEALDEFPPRRFIVVGLPVAVIVGIVFLSVLGLLLALGRWRGWDPFGLRRSWGRRVAAAALLTAALSVLVGISWPSITLRQATVITRAEGCVTGAYISSDSDGVHLADGVRHTLRTIPTAEVIDVTIGAKRPLVDLRIGPCSRLAR